MATRYLLSALIILFVLPSSYGEEIIIQEYDTGFCSVDGAILTDVAGYTGDGYADTDRGVGKSVSWNVFAEAAGPCTLRWRYANGGGSGDRPATLLLNGTVTLPTVNFPHTGTWTHWTESGPVSIDLMPGHNTIRLEAHSVDGLANYDYLVVDAQGVTQAACIPAYTLTVMQNDVEGGTISYEPIQPYYDEGTPVTVTAQAKPGYRFQSWSGEVASTASTFTFAIKQNTTLAALFFPEGTRPDPNCIGYAAIQDDLGTPYWVLGGALGPVVEVNSVAALQDYLSRPDPYVVTVSAHIVGDADLKVTSNKTLLGTSNAAHLEGLGVRINEARNVIVRNLKISHVTPQDAIEINGKSKNIWIDHCELYSDRDHGSEYYDGLLDIKNESTFITISWCVIHDHYKTSLISSNDTSPEDGVIRVTYHHNFFYNCNSRLPLIRFGKAHIFNNYYKDCSDAVNTRMGACVRVEKNVFINVGKPVFSDFSVELGYANLIDNYYDPAYQPSVPGCILAVPYDYARYLDEPNALPSLIAGETVDIQMPEPVSYR